MQVVEENVQLIAELSEEMQAADAAVKQVRVSITCAGSPLAYHVISMIGCSQVFGSNIRIKLNLFDDQNLPLLSATVMEAVDLASGSIYGPPVVTSDLAELFAVSDLVLLLDDVTAGQGEPRADWLRRVDEKFRSYGRRINSLCRRDVLIVVPALNSAANVIGSTLTRSAPNIPSENIVVTSRLAENRVRGCISRHCGVNPGSVVDLVVWGDASAVDSDRFVIDVSRAKVNDCETSAVWGPEHLRSVKSVIHDSQWIRRDLPLLISSSSLSSISSYVSTANALISFLSDLWESGSTNTPNRRLHSLTVASKGDAIFMLNVSTKLW